MTWLFSGILFICALVVSFAALVLRARATNDTTRAQINNIPSKSHVIPLLIIIALFIQLQLEICVCAAMNSEFAYVDDAVVIDLSDINSVTVDVQSKVCFTDIRESF